MERPGWLRALGPGLLVAATGVGAGDLATGAFTGAKLGVAVLWAAVAGAVLKFVLTEGLARWQIATGETLLEGALRRVPRPARWLFLLYLLPWTWFVGSALISACGVAVHALLPGVFGSPGHGKVGFGIACSLLGLALVEAGGYRWFERVMKVCVGVMFVTTVTAAALTAGDAWPEIARGLLVPVIPAADKQSWTVALMGGVGGTLTILCYGYWLREEGRDKPEFLGLCRLDLGVGYAVTALFGVAIVILGSRIEVSGSGAGLVVALGDSLGEALGPAVRVAFLLGAFSAVFSSLLGVWQSVPLVFADFWQIARHDRTGPVDTRSAPYRAYLWIIAIVPMLGLMMSFAEVQLVYAIVGAAFLPLIAAVLLVLNGFSSAVPARLRNRPLTSAALVATLAFFVYYGLRVG